MHDASPPLTLSLADAARLLGIGVSTAYRLCARDEFPVPVLRIGGTVKVSAKRLRDYVDGKDAAAAG
jgi:predicted DNA-binding transcriptional regulator AlpA